MRLYRAMEKEQEILNSNERAFLSGEINPNIDLISEMYSHIVRSSNNEFAKEKRIIFSFTDNIDKALEILNVYRYSNYYDRIGYIDVDFLGYGIDDKIKWVWPVYHIDDWVKVAYYLKMHSDTIVTFNNLNYEKISDAKNLVNTLIPSQNGVCSYANVYNEYHIICNGLKPKSLNESEYEKEKQMQNYILDFPILDQYFYDRIASIMLNDLEGLDVQNNRKKEVRQLILKHSNIEKN